MAAASTAVEVQEQLSLSDDDEHDVLEVKSILPTPPSLSGTFSKWTNYIHGWQDRYICLQDATLSYYKSENETAFGCRGAISIRKAVVKVHEFDECRFDVSVGDCVWYLRADGPETRNKWVDAIETYKHFIDSAYGSENSLRRHGSTLSLSSASISSFKKGWGLLEKVAEVETYRDILCRQIDSLQSFLDEMVVNVPRLETSTAAVTEFSTVSLDVSSSDDTTLANNFSSSSATTSQVTGSTVTTKFPTPQQVCDFKGEAITFKATTAGILATISHCIDLMQQREEVWKRRFDKEVERRKRLEEQLKQQHNNSTTESSGMATAACANGHTHSLSPKVILGPDYEEGPQSKIKEEEFFDALDAMLDKQDKQLEEKRILKIRAKEIGEPSASLPESVDHPLWTEVQSVTMDQLYYARLDVSDNPDDPAGWQLFAQEGEMRLYRREVETDGLVCDPLKAVHTVEGVSGHEVCYHFFSPDVRWDWENTLESMKVVEEVNPNTLVFHQIHKRVWPAAQRDAVFWSHIRRVLTNSNTEESKENTRVDNANLHDVWIVTNKSTDIHEIPTGSCVRMKMTVSMTCETFINPDAKGREITRDDLTCRIIYCSTINPGGWAPASVLRALYKREYPKFLKRFTQYVIDAQEKKPILF